MSSGRDRQSDLADVDERPLPDPSPRVLAFEALYEFDVARHPVRDVLARLAADQGADAACARSAGKLVEGVLADRREYDATIARLAPAWPLAQMSAVDRNILRLALFELRLAASTGQERAVINAAVELAKRYGGDSSPRFVRGVLGRAAGWRKPTETSGDPNLPG